MNSTLSTAPKTFVNNSLMANVEPWFIPFDILAIIFLISAVTLATTFLFIIILDKTYHTVPMMLTANICLTALVCSSNTLAMSVFTLQNDLQQIQYYDSLCIVRGYLTYVTCALHNYSYLLSAIYRFMIYYVSNSSILAISTNTNITYWHFMDHCFRISHSIFLYSFN